MAFEKFSKDAATKTHGAVEATMIDLVMPHIELVGSTNNTIRSGVYALGGWLARGKKETGRFSMSGRGDRHGGRRPTQYQGSGRWCPTHHGGSNS
jgi:hypothetical protein